MEFMTREEYLAVDDLNVEILEVPEWKKGGKPVSVRIKMLGGLERAEFEDYVTEKRGNDVKINTRTYRQKLVARCVVDEKGERVFSDADVEALGKKSGRALARISERASKLNGFSKEDVDELVGNSNSGQHEEPTSS